MRKQTPTIEWIVTESDAEWERLPALALPTAESETNRHLPLQRTIWSLTVLLLLLVAIGDWWRRSQSKAPLATAEVTVPAQTTVPDREALIATISAEQATATWWLQWGEEDFGVSALRPTAEPTAPLDVVLQSVEILGDQAVVRFVTTAPKGATTYRQTHFYQHTAAGWRQTEPDAALWGTEQQWETPYFIFHFRQNDAPAVMAVTPRLDALYTTVHRNFGLLLSPGVEKMVIEVQVTKQPGYGPSWFEVPGRIGVPSPARYLAPVALTDVELLEQALALLLLRIVLAQASEQYAIRGSWQPMHNGLHLWQLWELDLPLSAWRDDVTKWLYQDAPATGSAELVRLPARYQELCTIHNLWLRSPVEIGVPFWCHGVERKRSASLWWSQAAPPTRLAHLGVPVSANAHSALAEVSALITYPGQTVVLASLIEYAVATYGRDTVPILVAGLGRYESWETLIPAVYGVLSADFEAGWQAHLTTHYGIALSNDN